MRCYSAFLPSENAPRRDGRSPSVHEDDGIMKHSHSLCVQPASSSSPPAPENVDTGVQDTPGPDAQDGVAHRGPDASLSSNVESMISKLLDEKLQPIHTKLDQLCELSGKIDQLKADVKEATNILVMEVIRRCHEVQTATEGGYEDLVGTIAHLSEDVKTMAEAVERRTRFNLE
eukprot:GHVU01209514.1.p1 GENE.GHVU01209514.1~~GHVU01209514.1.p1  ORF type:complete len:174 (+),score=23.69 GHVU01209514.1:966-1487(+)